MPLSHYHPQRYQTLLGDKLATIAPRFKPLFAGEPDIFASPPSHYRMRAEFRMWHEGEHIDFLMFGPSATPHTLVDFPVASRHISDRMPPLKALLEKNELLRRRLFQVEFLTTARDDTLISLIYHKKLDDQWQAAALELQDELQVQIIGRSRKQKRVLERDFVTEWVPVHGREYRYRQTEGVFTQPNGFINRHMIEWLLDQIPGEEDDLLELYCGIGNFTLPMAQRFRKVLATEISKQAVACARHNAQANGIDNLTLLRMSSEEFTQAMDGVRPFRRLKDIDLGSFELNTVLVDPPRAGLDPATLALVNRIHRIVYISCNPDTLLQNLESLGQTHRIQQLAFFDQFPYTPHLECGVILHRK
jgi:tRNA (uracil-5-)-methyltransferase